MRNAASTRVSGPTLGLAFLANVATLVIRPALTLQGVYMTSLSIPSFQSDASKTATRGKIAFIQACWHRDIVDQARDSFVTELAKLSDQNVELFEVSGAFEIPLHAKLLAATGKYSAIVAAGLVVDGGIYRHDFVADAVIKGLMQVQLETGTPVFSVVLTPHQFHGNTEHVGFFSEHFVTKGAEAAVACADTLEKFQKI